MVIYVCDMFLCCCSQLKLGDSFVGYQDDTTAAVVFQAYHNMRQAQQCDEIIEDELWESEVAFS